VGVDGVPHRVYDVHMSSSPPPTRLSTEGAGRAIAALSFALVNEWGIAADRLGELSTEELLTTAMALTKLGSVAGDLFASRARKFR